MKKEVQTSTKTTTKKDLYFTIYSLLKEGLNPSKICDKYNISKQRLNYYVGKLKTRKLVQKIGYGVWEVSDKYTKRSTNYEKKITAIGTTFNEISNIGTVISPERLRKILKLCKLDKCLVCSNKVFELHHIVEKNKGGEENIKNLIPVCPNHHHAIHLEGYSELMKKQIKNYYMALNLHAETKEDMVRGHAFMFKLNLPSNLKNWGKREEIFKKINLDFDPLILGGTVRGQKLYFKGRKVWLTEHSIIIYEQSSYLSDTAQLAKDYAIADLLTLVKALERRLQADLSFAGKYKFKVSRQHYSLIKNALAKQYNREGKKLEIYNSSGLWFLIDNSYNLNEAETVHPITAVKDNEKVQNFFNGLKGQEGYTPAFVITSIGKNAENLENYAVHLKSHVQSIKDLGVGVKELTKVVKELKK